MVYLGFKFKSEVILGHRLRCACALHLLMLVIEKMMRVGEKIATWRNYQGCMACLSGLADKMAESLIRRLSLPDLSNFPLPLFAPTTSLPGENAVEMSRICLGLPASLTSGPESDDGLDRVERGVAVVAEVHHDAPVEVEHGAGVEGFGDNVTEPDNISAEIEMIWRLTDDLPDSNSDDDNVGDAAPGPR